MTRMNAHLMTLMVITTLAIGVLGVTLTASSQSDLYNFISSYGSARMDDGDDIVSSEVRQSDLRTVVSQLNLIPGCTN